MPPPIVDIPTPLVREITTKANVVVKETEMVATGIVSSEPASEVAGGRSSEDQGTIVLGSSSSGGARLGAADFRELKSLSFSKTVTSVCAVWDELKYKSASFEVFLKVMII